jgi:hypothetical protein
MPGIPVPYGPGWNSQTHTYNTPASTTPTSGLPSYNVSPSPTGGQGPYGAVPGNIGIPPNAFQQATSVAPGLAKTGQLTNNIMSELQGDINPQALKNMQEAAASYGISSGMPGSNAVPGTLAFNKNLRNIGLDTLSVQRQGQQDYLSALQGIGATQTPQSLATEVAAHNAQLNAAPDPSQAAAAQLQAYWSALNATRGPGGGSFAGPSPGGGTGAYSPTPFSGGTPALGGGSPGGGVNYGTDFSVGQPSGSSLSWAGSAPTDLFGDIGSGYDQSAGTDFSGYDQALSNPEDYYAGLLAGS